MEKKFRSNKNFWKINTIYLLLIISNIILIMGLFYYYSKLGIDIDINTVDSIATIIATIIILGFISVRLPKLRERGGSLYDISYLIIITIIGLVDSYFNGKVNTPILFGTYLEMFKILSVILIFVLLATKLRPFKGILQGKHTRYNQIVCLVIFALCGLFASYVHININGAPANIRCTIVMISGLFGGPYVGIPVGIISGAYRYSLGGITALPCAISTVISGIIGSLIFMWNDKKFPRSIPAITLMFLFTGFEMMLVIIATPPQISFSYIGKLYPLMLFASVVGIIVFSMVIKEEREKMEAPTSYEEHKIKKLENELEQYVEKIEDLEKDLMELKKEKFKDDSYEAE